MRRHVRFTVVIVTAAMFVVLAKFVAEPLLQLVMLVECPVAECDYGHTAYAIIWGATAAIVLTWSFMGLLWARRRRDDVDE